MTLKLAAHHQQILRSHAEQAYPNECCGLFLGRRDSHNHPNVLDIRAVDNTWDADVAQALEDDTSQTKTNRYWIAPQTLLTIVQEARQLGYDIIGVYHSHTDHPAVPSECDRRLAWQHYSYLILSVRQGICQDMQSWRLDDSHQFQPEAIELSTVSTPQPSPR